MVSPGSDHLLGSWLHSSRELVGDDLLVRDPVRSTAFTPGPTVRIDTGDLIAVGGQAAVVRALLPDGWPVAVRVAFAANTPATRTGEAQMVRLGALKVVRPDRYDALITVHHSFYADAVLRPDSEPYRLFCQVVEYCRSNLRMWVRSDPGPSVRTAVERLLPVFSTLGHLHTDLGIVHRDVCDQNILVDGDGRLKLIDFGIAHELADGQTHETVTALGKAGRTPPEADLATAQTPISPAWDVWLCGWVLVETALGVDPFLTRGAVSRSGLPDHPRLAELPAPVRDVALKMLDPDRRNRPTLSEVVARLQAWLGSGENLVTLTVPPTPAAALLAAGSLPGSLSSPGSAGSAGLAGPNGSAFPFPAAAGHSPGSPGSAVAGPDGAGPDPEPHVLPLDLLSLATPYPARRSLLIGGVLVSAAAIAAVIRSSGRSGLQVADGGLGSQASGTLVQPGSLPIPGASYPTGSAAPATGSASATGTPTGLPSAGASGTATPSHSHLGSPGATATGTPASPAASGPTAAGRASGRSPSSSLSRVVTGGRTLVKDQQFGRHTDAVTRVAFSPDGTTLASASSDNTVKLWDLRTGSLLRTLTGHSSRVHGVKFSPDGRSLATCSDDYTTRIWNPATGATLRTLVGHTSWVLALDYSPDGSLIATASHDLTVRIWDAASGSQLRTLTGHTQSVQWVSFHPNGSRVVTGAGGDATDTAPDSSAGVWDVASGRRLQTLTGHTDLVTSATWSPDGATIATSSWDGTIRLWDAAGRTSQTLVGTYGPALAASFSPDGTTLAAGCWDGGVRLWDTATGTPVANLAIYPSQVWGVAYGPTSALLGAGVGDGTAHCLRLA